MIELRASGIAGQGVFMTGPLRARHKVGEIGGTYISLREGRRRIHKQNIYIVEISDTEAVDASFDTSGLKYVNHSCAPNARLQVRNRRIEIFAIRDLNPGDELTVDYGTTHHEGTLPCKCGAPNCRKFI